MIERLLSNYDRNIYLNTSKNNVTYEEFIHNDMIHFSNMTMIVLYQIYVMA